MSDHEWVPNRPCVPFSLYLLCACGATSQVVLALRLRMGRPWAVVAACVAAMALAARGMGSASRATAAISRVVLAAGTCGICACLASAQVGVAEGTARALERSAVSSCELEVCADASLGTRGYRARAHVWRGGARLGDVWVRSEKRYDMGTRVRAVGRFGRGTGEWRLMSERQGVCGTISVVHALEVTPASGPRTWVNERRRVALVAMEPERSDARAILAGSVCGSKDAMVRSGIDKVFAACGVAHLVAVSGGHIAIVGALVERLLGKTRLGPVVRTLVLLETTGLFVLFCGAPVSAVRSWLMCLVAFGSRVAGRRGHSLSAVCAVALGMVMVDPAVTGQVGFVLSVASVVWLCLLSPYFGYALRQVVARPRLPARVPRPVRHTVDAGVDFVRDTLSACLVAQFATAAITCSMFSQLSLVAPLANLVLALPFTVMVGAGMAVACLGGTPLAAVPLVPCDVAGTAVSWLLGWMSRLPYACVAVSCDIAVAGMVTIGVTAAILVWWPTVRRGPMLAVTGSLAAVSLCLLLRWRFFSPARVCVLDVGQGDAILVQQGVSAVLVDAGPDQAAAAELARLHVMHIDAVVVTHMHDDHFGGVGDVLGEVPCDAVFVARGVRGNIPDEFGEELERHGKEDVREVGLGDELEVGDFRLRVVWPEEPVDGSENADSIELALTYDDGSRTMSGLLTGDAEKDETAGAISAGRVGDVDFLKVGHHGSKVSVTQDEARELAPEVSVASAGAHNRYGHPSPECRRVLEHAGSRFLCTMDVGTVTLEPGERGVRVFTERSP